VREGLSPEDILACWDDVMDGAESFVPASTAEYVAHREERLRAGR
jgi:hypothetical protein